MAGQKQTQDAEIVRQINDTWDSARVELSRLRERIEQAVQMGEAHSATGRVRSEREAALLKLGEAFYKLAESGDIAIPTALKRAVGEVKAKDAELLRQQADIAAILKEADSLVEKSRRVAVKKKVK